MDDSFVMWTHQELDTDIQSFFARMICGFDIYVFVQNFPFVCERELIS